MRVQVQVQTRVQVQKKPKVCVDVMPCFFPLPSIIHFYARSSHHAPFSHISNSLPSCLLSLLFSILLITYIPVSQPTSNTQSDTEPVASLASRISGLSTSSATEPSNSSETPPPPAPEVKGSETRPKFNAGGNNLFGRALAGAKSDRPAASTSTSATTPSTAIPTPAKTETKDEKKEEMTNPNLMDDGDVDSKFSYNCYHV
jgi:hypothetical protein